MNTTYEPAKLAGTCRSGGDKVRGVLYHAVPKGSWYDKAVCGVEPRRTSNGWYPSKDQQNVTCSNCLKKLSGANK